MVTENEKKTEKIKDNLDFFVFFLSSFMLHGSQEIGKTFEALSISGICTG